MYWEGSQKFKINYTDTCKFFILKEHMNSWLIKFCEIHISLLIPTVHPFEEEIFVLKQRHVNAIV